MIKSETLLFVGAVVLVLWAHVVFFDRIWTLRMPWSRWARPAERMRPISKVMATAFAVLSTVVFAFLLLKASTT